MELAIDGWTKDVFYPACHLELVTPVEARVLYRVKQNMYGRSYEVKSPTPIRTVAAFFYGGENPAYTEEKALAAAEAECARLNVAHRKEVEK